MSTHPVLDALERAPIDDMPETEDERDAVSAAKARAHGGGGWVPLDDVGVRVQALCDE